jgi:hypothetical protein
MSHISKYNNEVPAFATPFVGRSVRDFFSEHDVVATPRRFTSVATPMSRRIQYQPDLVAGLEEDEHKEEIEGAKNTHLCSISKFHLSCY